MKMKNLWCERSQHVKEKSKWDSRRFCSWPKNFSHVKILLKSLLIPWTTLLSLMNVSRTSSKQKLMRIAPLISSLMKRTGHKQESIILWSPRVVPSQRMIFSLVPTLMMESRDSAQLWDEQHSLRWHKWTYSQMWSQLRNNLCRHSLFWPKIRCQRQHPQSINTTR